MLKVKIKNQKSLVAIVLIAGLLSAACGRSPLLNHKTEGDEPVAQVSTQGDEASNGECFLRWSVGDAVYGAQAEWILPPVVGENRIRIKFNADMAGQLTAFADMPDMGHGTAPISVTAIDARTYELRNVWLTMNGTWVMHVVINGVEASYRVEL